LSSPNGEHIDTTKERDNMNDSKNQLREDAIEFAIEISDLCDEMKGCSVYLNQIVRSSSSIGANIHEARYVQSRADFVNKLGISLKECSETEYWLELIFRKGKMTEATYRALKNKCGSIRRRLISSITTAKGNSGGSV
jgi:four helix bundle protein